MAKWIRRLASNQKIVGSTPTEGYFKVILAQLGERQTEDLKVPGSIPGLGIDNSH